MAWDFSNLSSIIESATSGTANIIAATKGNVSTRTTNFGVGAPSGSSANPVTGVSSIVSMAVLGGIAIIAYKLLKRR